MGTPLTIRVLGPLEVERPDGPVSIGPPMQRRLLCALVMAAGSTVAVDTLVDALWGHDPPTSARNSLQSHVARLRASLGPEPFIVTRPAGYMLDVELVDIDAVDFAAEVRRARRSDDHDEVVAGLTTALTWWRGRAHDEFADDLAADEVVRLESLRSEAEELLARSMAGSGDLGGAVEVLQALVARRPLHEPAVLALARTLGTLGRVPDALAAVDSHRTRLAEDLGLDPSRDLEDLQQALLRGEVEPRVDRVPTSANGRDGSPGRHGGAATRPPRMGTPTFGRGDEQQRVLAALAGAPVVTLVGPGGVGKTRLAQVVATSRDGAAWIDCATARAPTDLAPVVLDALGADLAPDLEPDAVAAHAIAGHAGLVVLDNCEHLLDAVADLVDEVLDHDPETTLLTTSRQRLDVAGEVVVPIDPLPVPGPDDATHRDAAVQLVQHHLTSAGGDAMPPGDAARLAAAVDGLPLAVELAAPHAAALATDTLLDGLATDLSLLAGNVRRHGERHHTMQHVLDWSHDLLDPSARTLFRRLSVWAAAFTVDDARCLADDDLLPATSIASTLARLVETSMVHRVDQGRYRLLQPLRPFASRMLQASGERAEVRARHRDTLVALAERGDREVSGPAEVAVMADLEAAMPDLRAVRARAVEHGDLATLARLVGRLYRFAYLQARTDALAWGQSLAADDEAVLAVEPRVRARAVAAAAAAAWMGGRVEHAAELAARAGAMDTDAWAGITVAEVTGDLHVALGNLADAAEAYTTDLQLARRVGHAGLVSQAESGLALTRSYLGERSAALTLVQQAVAHADEAGAPSTRALARYTLGEILSEPDPDAALEAFDRALREAERARARFYTGLVRTADVALRSRHGDPEVALSRYRDAITIWRDRRAGGMLATTLRNLVILLARVGADEHALALHHAIGRHVDKPTFGAEADRIDRAVTTATKRLDGEARREAERWAASTATLHETADLALVAVAASLDARPA